MSDTNTGGGSGDGGRLGRIPEQVAKQAAGIGRVVGDAIGPKAEDIANRSKATGADAVAGVARTAEALADTVAPNRSQPIIMLASAALIGFALSRVFKAGVATAPADTASNAPGGTTFGSEG
jgi:hypothetical protein